MWAILAFLAVLSQNGKNSFVEACNPPPSLQVKEDQSPDTPFHFFNKTEFTDVKIPEVGSILFKYFTIEDVGDGFELRVKNQNQISDAVDCLIGDLENGDRFSGRLSGTCPDGSTFDTSVIIYVTPVNNREPKFSDSVYVINDVTTLPANLKLSDLYPQIDITVQDIDAEKGKPVGNLQITIEDDIYNIFRAESIVINKTSDVCVAVGEIGERYYALKVEIILADDLTDQITNQSYTVRILATDPGGQSGETKLTLNFKPRDISPPIFEHLHYSAKIDKPEWTQPIPLVISPAEIKAEDGDETRQVVNYKLETTTDCAKHFSIEDPSKGIITWKESLSTECGSRGLMILLVTAFQVDKPDTRKATVTVTVEVSKGENNPIFTQLVYESEQLKLNQAKPGDLLVILNGPIEANSNNPATTAGLSYYLVEGEKIGFEIPNPEDPIVKLSKEFDIELLGSDGLTTLIIEVQEKLDAGKKSLCEIKVPFQVDSLPPKFDENIYTQHISDPKFPGTPQELLTVSAKDGDDDIKEPVKYSLTSVCPGCFSVDPSSGKVSWIGSLPKEIVKQRQTVVTLKAEQVNKASQFAEVQLIVSFPGDELDPKFTSELYKGQVSIKGEVSSDIIKAQDGDEYLNEEVEYSISGDLFVIDTATGVVSSAPNFDPNALIPLGNPIELILRASQKDDPSKYGVSKLHLSYVENSKDPEFNKNFVQVYAVDSDSLELTKPKDLFALDTDKIDGVVIDYELMSTDFSDKYTVSKFDDNSVKLTLANPPSSYDSFVDILRIKALEKNAIPDRFSIAIVRVESNTTSTCTSTFEFDELIYETSLSKPATSNDTLVKVSADREDCLIGKVTYKIVKCLPNSLANYFSINPDEGMISYTIKDGTSKPSPQIVTLELSAEADSGLLAEATVSIEIMYSNDFKPTFTSGDFGKPELQVIGYPGFLKMDGFVQQPLTSMEAKDADGDELTFSILNDGSDFNKFFIDPEVGQLFPRETSERQDFSGICSEKCSVKIEVSDKLNKVTISAELFPLGETYIVPLKLNPTYATQPEAAISKLNQKFTTHWFRMLSFGGPTTGSKNIRSVRADASLLYVTVHKPDGFLTRDEASSLFGEDSEVATVDEAIDYPVDGESEETLQTIVIGLGVALGIVILCLLAVFGLINRKKIKNIFRKEASNDSSIREGIVSVTMTNDEDLHSTSIDNYVPTNMKIFSDESEVDFGPKKRPAPSLPPATIPIPLAKTKLISEKKPDPEEKKLSFSEDMQVITSNGDTKLARIDEIVKDREENEDIEEIEIEPDNIDEDETKF